MNESPTQDWHELLDRARSAEEAGNLAEARAYLERAAMGAPEDWAVQAWLARLYHDTEQLTAAADSYRRALELNPDAAGLHSSLATVLVDLNRPEDAEAHLTEALRLGCSPARLVLLGDVQRAIGKTDQAEASFREALSMDPEDEEAAYNLAMLIRRDRPAESLSLLARAVVIDPHYAEAHRELGLTQSGLGRHEDAESSLRTALALDPEDESAHVYLYEVLSRLGKVAEAEAELKVAEALAPGWSLPKKLMGDLVHGRGDVHEAEVWYRSAVQVDPHDVAAGLALARLLEQSGRSDEARRLLIAIKRLDPH